MDNYEDYFTRCDEAEGELLEYGDRKVVINYDDFVDLVNTKAIAESKCEYILKAIKSEIPYDIILKLFGDDFNPNQFVAETCNINVNELGK